MCALKRVSEALGTGGQVEELEPIQALFNTDVIVDSVAFGQGNFGEYVLIRFRYNEKDAQHVTRTSSRVIIDKLRRVENELPLVARIVRRKRYYDIE